MKNRYYFLGTLLPPLTLGEEEELSFRELIHLLQDNLSKRDYDAIVTLRTLYDILNIRCFWKDEALDPRGNLTEVDLEEALLTGSALPDYVHDFLREESEREERLRKFPKLITLYFREEISKAKGLLKEYLEFERGLRLTLVGFRAKRLKRNLAEELLYEDPSDELVVQLLAQRDAHHYEPPQRFEEIKGIFEQHANAPVALHKAALEYRFKAVDEMIGTDTFSADYILSYFLQHLFVESWNALDSDEGKTIVDKLLRDVS